METPQSFESSPSQTENDILTLGRLCAAAVVNPNVLAEHQSVSSNPNTVGPLAVPFNAGEIASEPGKVYRQVGIEALHDLAATGLVRNGATAEGREHARWGNRVFWSQGQAGAYMNTGDRAVLVAPEAAAAHGWVTGSPN